MLSHINKTESIDVINLFSKGNNVPWPADDSPGFLSYMHCQNLWNLGARPHMTSDEAKALIENVITCANMSAHSNRQDNNIYTNAYKELTMYLRHLFVYYDSLVTNEELETGIQQWGWFHYLKWLNDKADVEKVVFVTYNYDIWLERILTIAGIDFDIANAGPEADRGSARFSIIKPHGSISFTHEKVLPKSSFQIKHEKSLMELLEGKVTEFKIRYTDLEANYPINPIIPPAGDSGRINCVWAKVLRDKAVEVAESLYEDSEVILCGISYWHVDRAEMDQILTSIEPNVTVKLINPKPPATLNAVLSTLFSNYLHYTSSSTLGVIAHEPVL